MLLFDPRILDNDNVADTGPSTRQQNATRINEGGRQGGREAGRQGGRDGGGGRQAVKEAGREEEETNILIFKYINFIRT